MLQFELFELLIMIQDMMVTKGSSYEMKLEHDREWQLWGRPLGWSGGESLNRL